MNTIDALRQAVAAAPNDIVLRVALARQLATEGRLREALDELTTASSLASRPDEREVVRHGFDDVLTTWVQPAGDPATPSAGSDGPAWVAPRLPHAIPPPPPLPPPPAPPPTPPDASKHRERARATSGTDDGGAAAGFDPDVEHPEVTLDDAAGLDDVKQHLDTKVFAPLRNPDLARRFNRVPRGGLLLWGPPGCGKTFIARALAGSLDISFCSAGLDEILGMYMGDSETGLARMFAAARRVAPSVLFLDEFDALGGQRSQMGANRAYRSLVSGLLVELDGVGASNDGVFTVAATNMPWDVDQALRRPGRFDRTVFVPPPDKTAIAAILAARLAPVPLAADVNVISVAKLLKGRSGADVRAVADSAIDAAFTASVDASSDVPVTQRQLLDAASTSGSSIESWVAQATVVAEASHDVEMFSPFFAWLDRR